jgi:DNA-binding CsgD family transcriptional regulator
MSDAPAGTAVLLLDAHGEIALSSAAGERWLAEHFGPADHPAWLPEPVAEWLALPPRPPLVSLHEGRRLTLHLLPGDPHLLLLEEEFHQFRPDALIQLGLTAREQEVLGAAQAIVDEAAIADELFLSVHAVSDRLDRVEAKLGVHTGAEAVAEALRASA